MKDISTSSEKLSRKGICKVLRALPSSLRFYILSGVFLTSVNVENSVQLKSPYETTKFIASMKLTKQSGSFSSISTSSSNISVSVSFRRIHTEVLNRHHYIGIGSANHPFKFLVLLNQTFRFLVPLNALIYIYAKIKGKLKQLSYLIRCQ